MTQYDAFEARLLDIGFGGVFRHCSLLFGLRQRRSARDGEWTDRELLTMRYHVRLTFSCLMTYIYVVPHR